MLTLLSMSFYPVVSESCAIVTKKCEHRIGNQRRVLGTEASMMESGNWQCFMGFVSYQFGVFYVFQSDGDRNDYKEGQKVRL